MTTNTMDHEQVTTATNKKTKITITATGNPPSFAMNSQFENGGGHQNGSKLQFDQNAGAFTLTFELADQSGLGLSFYPDAADSLWVSSNAICPVQPGNGGGAITFGAVKSGKLTADNANLVKADLAFELRFTSSSPGSTPPYIYDPTIGNGGTGNMDEGKGEGCD